MSDEKLIKYIAEVIGDNRIVDKFVLVTEFNRKHDVLLLNKIMDATVDTYYIVPIITSKYVSDIVKNKFINNSLSDEYEYVLKCAIKAAVKEYECKKRVTASSIFNIYYWANSLLICSSFDNVSIHEINSGAEEVEKFTKQELLKHADKLTLDVLNYYRRDKYPGMVRCRSNNERLTKLTEQFGFTLAMFIYMDAGKFEREEITLEKFTRVVRESCYKCCYLDKETIEKYIYGDES